MKCRACHAEDLVRPRLSWWKSCGVSCLLAAPVQCRHCLATSLVPFWRAIGLPSSAVVGGDSDSRQLHLQFVLPLAWVDIQDRRAA
jgi:hypothetical protein